MSGYGSDEWGHGLPDQLDSSGVLGYNAHERIRKTACERSCFTDFQGGTQACRQHG